MSKNVWAHLRSVTAIHRRPTLKSPHIAILALTVLLIAALAPAAGAAVDARTLHFSTAMVAHLGGKPERDGAMTISIDAKGNITGTYRGSAPPSDPFYNKDVPVSGTLSGDRIHLEIGPNGDVHVDGSLDENGIVATGSIGGVQLYDFVAAPTPSG